MIERAPTPTLLKAGLLLLGLLAAAASSAATLRDVQNRGNMRVGIALAAPWAMREESGELRGFEIDVARKLAADMGVEVQFRPYDFGALIRALESGEVDLIAAGLPITPERALHVNFSAPYATGGIGMATHLTATADVDRLEDLNDPAFTVAIVRGSVAAGLAERILPRATLELFASESEAAQAAVSGEAEIYLDQEPYPTYLALEHPDVIDVPVNQPLVPSPFGFAVAKGDADFVFFLNAWITAREADTWLPTTYQYWFKSLRWRD